MPESHYTVQVDEKDSRFDIEIEDRDGCYRYCGLIIRDIKSVDSPLWLKRALVASGLRPISFVVDVTNFVMLETGHPVHAFDLDRFSESRILVRKGKEGERLTLLDGREIISEGFECFITDGTTPLGLGGIMGGVGSGVAETTRNVLLEVATFNPVLIRKTCKAHNIQSDASYRFERGVDPNNNRFVIERLAHLIQKETGARVTTEIIDRYPRPIANKNVGVRKARIEKILGYTYRTEDIRKIFLNLGISTQLDEKNDVFECQIPTSRPDLEREIDLIEEVGRIYGYEPVPSIMPLSKSNDKGRSPFQRFRNVIHTQALSLGYNEVKPLSFIDPSDYPPCGITEEHPWNTSSVTLVKPLSRDLSLLRPSLFFGLIKTLAYNYTRQSADMKVYEIGKVYRKAEPFDEEEFFGFAQMGAENPEDYTDKRKVSFYTFKGNIEEIVSHITEQVSNLSFASPDTSDPYCSFLYPTHSAVIFFKGQRIGIIGLVRKQVLSYYDIKTEVYAGEISLNGLYGLLHGNNREWESVQNLSYPSSRKDFSVLVPRGKEMGHVISGLKQIEYVESVKITDIFKGKNIPEGFVSVTISLILRSAESTITEPQVDTVIEKVKNLLTAEMLEIREI
jgi:phenylalanyl-tRNA synthetase beta chain